MLGRLWSRLKESTKPKWVGEPAVPKTVTYPGKVYLYGQEFRLAGTSSRAVG